MYAKFVEIFRIGHLDLILKSRFSNSKLQKYILKILRQSRELAFYYGKKNYLRHHKQSNAIVEYSVL